MNGHAVESGSHLTQTGIESAKAIALSTPQIHELDASKLTISPATSPREVPEPNSKEVFDMKTCTDHMVKVTWTSDAGWHAPIIEQYGPLTMMPIASCLHYATQCFEGMKVYRGYDGKLRLFRPEKNCKRLNMSSARVALPQFDAGELEKLMKSLLAIDGPSEFLLSFQ
jgi:branched-chain amino acid aminotransferase